MGQKEPHPGWYRSFSALQRAEIAEIYQIDVGYKR